MKGSTTRLGYHRLESLAAYETYRARLKADPEARENPKNGTKKRLILREERYHRSGSPATSPRHQVTQSREGPGVFVRSISGRARSSSETVRSRHSELSRTWASKPSPHSAGYAFLHRAAGRTLANVGDDLTCRPAGAVANRCWGAIVCRSTPQCRPTPCARGYIIGDTEKKWWLGIEPAGRSLNQALERYAFDHMKSPECYGGSPVAVNG